MFSPQNRRFSILVICASLLCMGTIGAVVLVETSNPDRDHTAATSRIVGYSGSLLMLLMVMIKSEASERKASRARHALRQDMNAVALHSVEVVKKVEHIETQADQVVSKVEKIEEQTNGHLLAAVRRMAEEIRASERYQMMHDPAFHEMIDPLLRRIVRELCDERFGKIGPLKPGD